MLRAGILSLSGALVIGVLSAYAGDTTHEYEFSAILPEATGFECVKNQAAADGSFITNNQSGESGTIAMPFGILEEAMDGATALGWFKPADFAYWVCDLRPTGGVGIPTVSFEYTPGDNPNNIPPYNQRGGLEKKGIITVCKTYLNPSGSNPPTTDANCSNRTFGNVSSLSITPSYLYDVNNPSWARMYFGLGYEPDPSDPPDLPLPSGYESFGFLDHYGEYTGTIKATITW